jgi:hypothetical protein
MKTKNILGLVAIVAIAVAVAFNVTVSNKKTDTASLLALKNVEALAGGEVDFEFYCRGTEYAVCAEEKDENGEPYYLYGVRVNNPN